MKQPKFNITDESQDRKYFSLVPNYIINHSTLEERGFYLTLKRIAGEDSQVYYSPKKLADLCGIKKTKLYELIDKLLNRGWIEIAGTVPTGHKPRRTYAIADIWKQNIDFYEAKNKVRRGEQMDKVRADGRTKSVSTNTKEEPGKEKPNKEINKEKELVSLKGKYSSINSIGSEEFQAVAEYYQVSLAFVRSKYDDMVNWHESTGKVRKNWLATLRNFVKSDAIKIRKEVSNVDKKRGIDASRI